MIFYLASPLPTNILNILKDVYSLYEHAKQKRQVISKSKRGTTAKPLDLKDSNFRCLRGIETSGVNRLLSEVKDCELSLRELSIECISIKQLQKVQATFVKGTNATSWEDAQHKFPQYATASQLEPF